MDPSILIRVTTLLTFISSVLFVTRHPATVKTFLKTISGPVTHLLALPQRKSLPALDENPTPSEPASTVTRHLTTVGNILKSLPSHLSRRLGLPMYIKHAESNSFKKPTIAFGSSVPSPALTLPTVRPLPDTLAPTAIVIHTLQPPHDPTRLSLHVSLDCSLPGLAAIATLCITFIILFLVVRRQRDHPLATLTLASEPSSMSTMATQETLQIPGLTDASAVPKDDMVPGVNEEEERNLDLKTSHGEQPECKRVQRSRNKDERVPSWV